MKLPLRTLENSKCAYFNHTLPYHILIGIFSYPYCADGKTEGHTSLRSKQFIMIINYKTSS